MGLGADYSCFIYFMKGSLLICFEPSDYLKSIVLWTRKYPEALLQLTKSNLFCYRDFEEGSKIHNLCYYIQKTYVAAKKP